MILDAELELELDLAYADGVLPNRGSCIKVAMNSTTSAIFGKLALYNPSNVVSPSSLPAFVYGTAWKKERSAELVYQALCTGFRAVDTAAQPKHYDEAGVGAGIRRAISEGRVARHDLFVSKALLICMCYDPSVLMQVLCLFRTPEATSAMSYSIRCRLHKSAVPTGLSWEQRCISSRVRDAVTNKIYLRSWPGP